MSNTESKAREFKLTEDNILYDKYPNPVVADTVKEVDSGGDLIELTPQVKKAVENHAAFKQLVMDILAQQGIGCHLSGEYERRAVELLKASE